MRITKGKKEPGWNWSRIKPEERNLMMRVLQDERNSREVVGETSGVNNAGRII